MPQQGLRTVDVLDPNLWLDRDVDDRLILFPCHRRNLMACVPWDEVVDRENDIMKFNANERARKLEEGPRNANDFLVGCSGRHVYHGTMQTREENILRGPSQGGPMRQPCLTGEV